MKQTKAYNIQVKPETARKMLKDVYQVDSTKPLNKAKYRDVELQEIDQLLAILNKQ